MDLEEDTQLISKNQTQRSKKTYVIKKHPLEGTCNSFITLMFAVLSFLVILFLLDLSGVIKLTQVHAFGEQKNQKIEVNPSNVSNLTNQKPMATKPQLRQNENGNKKVQVTNEEIIPQDNQFSKIDQIKDYDLKHKADKEKKDSDSKNEVNQEKKFDPLNKVEQMKEFDLKNKVVDSDQYQQTDLPNQSLEQVNESDKNVDGKLDDDIVDQGDMDQEKQEQDEILDRNDQNQPFDLKIQEKFYQVQEDVQRQEPQVLLDQQHTLSGQHFASDTDQYEFQISELTNYSENDLGEPLPMFEKL